MGRSKISALIGAALFFLPTAGALAADIPEIPPPAHFGGNWYLRGHIGMAAQHLSHLENASFAAPAVVQFLDPGNFDAAPIFGVGIGWRHSDHIRFDLTAEYRGKAHFAALDRYDSAGDGTFEGANDYTAKKSEITFLANGYWDFSPIHGITPYVGAGIGASYNIISDFRDINTPQLGVAYGATAGKLNLAWALHAGLSMQVTERLTLDLGYSYLNLGDAQSGDITTFTGVNSVVNPMIFKGITSHDLKFGVRWALGGSTNSYYPPVVKY